jgi:glutaredoxin
MKLYKFYKQGCYPCNTLSAILRRIELPEDIELVEIDAGLEENKEFVEEKEIEKVPVLLFENNKRLIGVKPKIIVEKFINARGDI